MALATKSNSRIVKLSIGQKGILLVMTPTIVWLSMIAMLVGMLSKAEFDFRREYRIRRTLSLLDSIEHRIFENGTLLYVYSKNQNQLTLVQLEKTASLMKLETKELIHDLKLEPKISKDKTDRFGQEVTELSNVFYKLRASLSADSRPLNGLEMTVLRVNAQQSVNKALELRAPLHEEISRLSEWAPAAAAASRKNVVVCLAFIVAITIGSVIAALHFFSTSITRRLAVIIDNLARIQESKALNAELTMEDEISAVDRSLHEMAIALAEAQRREKAMIDNARDLICSIEPDGVITNVNAACITVLGYDPDELKKTNLLSLVLPDQVTEVSDKLANSRDKGQPVNFETCISKRDGRTIYVLCSAAWSPVDMMFSCVIHDIDDIKKAQLLKQQLYDMVNHDLRSPLTFISGLLYLLGNNVNASPPQDLGRRVQKGIYECGRLSRLFEDVLSYERIEAGKLSLHLQRVSSHDCLLDALSTVEVEASNKLVPLEITGDDCAFDADRDRIVQILINLLTNAIKYSPRGSKVTLHSEIRGDDVYFGVSDQGRGIPEASKSKLFQRLERVEDSLPARDSTQRGTGLGLSICKLLVEAHAGHIDVESQDGRGSTFWFTIPRKTSIIASTQEQATT